MAEYQRFVSYMYAYVQDEKQENVGFAKVEVRGEQQRIQINLKGVVGVAVLNVCGFIREDSRCVCVPLGRMLVNAGNGQFVYSGQGEVIQGSPYRFAQVKGLVVSALEEPGKAYATVWDDEPFGLTMFAEPESEKAESETAFSLLSEAETEPEGGASVLTAAELETAELAAQEEISERDALWTKLKNRYEAIAPFSEAGVECLKVLPADIGQLPRPNWIYANNGFVMHGYIQFRYIIFARMPDGDLVIGVPGAHSISEQMMAEMFGFSQFKPIAKEDRTAGALGYWCIPVSGSGKRRG